MLLQILQNKMEKELPLYPSSDEQTTAGGMYSLPPVAHVCLKSLVSLPVEGNQAISIMSSIVQCN